MSKLKLGFIVEGTNDKRVVQMAKPLAEVVVTHGTRFTNATRMAIEAMVQSVDKVFILTDPDKAGDLLAKRIQDYYGFERIEVDPKKCMKYVGYGKWKHGIEHADIHYIKSVIEENF